MCRHFDVTGIEILYSEFGRQTLKSKQGRNAKTTEKEGLREQAARSVASQFR
jgi:hypothetical protein